MTMQVDRTQEIAGVGILEIRRFFRHLLAHHQESFARDWLIDFLRLSESGAGDLLHELVDRGFCKATIGQSEYELTDLARELVRSSAAKRVSRKTADEALAGLMSRVEEINANPKFLYSVRSVVVFGSYLKPNVQLGDLDVAIQVSSRIADPSERSQAALRYATDSGRQFKNYTERLYWAQAEIYQVLKNRQRTISIQPWHSFVGVDKNAGFQFQVIMGDKDQVAGDLKEAEERRRNS